MGLEGDANWFKGYASIWQRRAGGGDVADLTPLRFGWTHAEMRGA